MKKAAIPTPTNKSHFSMLKTLVLADFVTLGNGCCGACIIIFCLQFLADTTKTNFITYAFMTFPLAVVFDVLDGWVARFTNRQSILGADLDSLADLVSFGVAPAVLGFTLGLRGFFDCLSLLFYVCCAMSRLARFNAERMQLVKTKSGKVKFFNGFPTPFAMMIVVFFLGLTYFQSAYIPTYFHDFFTGKNKVWLYDFHPFSTLYFFVGCGMISNSLQIPHI